MRTPTESRSGPLDARKGTAPPGSDGERPSGGNRDEIAKVDGVPLLPLSQINERFTELDPNQTYYLHCKAGVRSLRALNFLRQQGFKYLRSVKGSITAWSEEIDSKVPRY
ncbi:MAG: hypothetical protein KJ070_25880 [Verrucomicrobia bacterium]|nr:hypothetical protein [Verrucomicrobiota bacterium]